METSPVSSSMDSARPVDTTASDFRSLLDRRGMLLEEADWYRVLGQLQVGNDLHSRCLMSSDGTFRFVSAAFANQWNGSEQFSGDRGQMELLLGHLHPTALPLPVGHISIDQLPKLALAARAWGITRGPLVDAIDFYLCRAVEVPASQKLYVASVSGSELLLESTLHNDCGKAEAITEITDNSLILDNISTSENGNVVMKRMLQHSGKCTDSGYLTQMSSQYASLLDECRSRLRSFSDFRPSIQDPLAPNSNISTTSSADIVGAGVVDSTEETQDEQQLVRVEQAEFSQNLDALQLVQLNVAGRIFECSREMLALYSPVLKNMLYGSFQEGRNVSVNLGVTEGCSVRASHLFLALLQPSGLNALWWLCPKEIAQLDWMDQHPIVDDLFDLIFDKSMDLVNGVFALAHKFQVTKLVRFCELMIDNKSDISLGEKIRLADLYHLPDLMARCLARLHTPSLFRANIYSDPNLLNDLDANTLKLLMERLLQVVA